MDIIKIITKKKDNLELTNDEIKYVISEYVKGTIPDYQMSSLLMAITINGMSDEETINLTNAMIKSGEIIDLSNIKGIKVDKHSTGGIGDKTTLIIAPLVASCGIPVAKMSGRGLGITGGTIDKLESIPGFDTSLSDEEFINNINNIGVAISSASKNIAPADKKIYALRDVTGTVASIPLIASSIMSKKIASGADKIVLDLKVGTGAFMTNLSDAKKLGELMVKIGNSYDKETVCIITDMNEPLGCNIGNALEVQEAIDVLQNNGDSDLKELCIELSAWMVKLAKDIDLNEAKKLVLTNLETGKAHDKFKDLVNNQHGDLSAFKISNNYISIKSKSSGYINNIDAFKVGVAVHQLGAGRNMINDNIDYNAGMILCKKTGEYIKEFEELCRIYTNKSDIDLELICDCFTISNNKISKPNLIISSITK